VPPDFPPEPARFPPAPPVDDALPPLPALPPELLLAHPPDIEVMAIRVKRDRRT
jgi:hypothetical protein